MIAECQLQRSHIAYGPRPGCAPTEKHRVGTWSTKTNPDIRLVIQES